MGRDGAEDDDQTPKTRRLKKELAQITEERNIIEKPLRISP
jgi:hypothetical protein